MDLFRHKHRHQDEDYERHGHSRPAYGSSYGPYEYTGQPVGFEHLGSPPKQKLSDMDPKIIAQLGYEGPEGDRRKMEAIKEQIYEREYDRAGYTHGVPPRHEGYEYTEGYGKHKHGHSKSSSHSHHGYRRDSDSDDDYAGKDERYRHSSRHGEPYGHERPGYVLTPPVHVDRKYEEDGTIVEHIYPANSAGATYGIPDPGKIHYGRQDSFPEQALQEAAAYAHSHGGRREYPAGYSHGRPPPPGYAAPYEEATSSYGRRPPYDGTSSEFVEERYRRY